MSFKCLDSFEGVFVDVLDGDQNGVTVAQGETTIKPGGYDRTWQVKDDFDTAGCKAIIDFAVHGQSYVFLGTRGFSSGTDCCYALSSWTGLRLSFEESFVCIVGLLRRLR